ncbi:MAG TPA: phosphoribosylformylglycinamidine synthase subunit PurS [Acidimicrobiales bacterium]|nr:phosphoribosylformylglycinamidine synthase subunit PurS [Acidimicrobiales bacterium]
MRFAVLVEVRPREGIANPEGATIQRAVAGLGYEGVSGVRVGKAIRFHLDAPDEAAARAQVEELCRRFLTNPVIEDADVSLAAEAGAGQRA